MSERSTAIARVQVTVDVQANGSWPVECSVHEIIQQARTECAARVRNALEGRCTIVGVPLVTIVSIQEVKT